MPTTSLATVMTPHFIFCSGWGFDAKFWQPLLSYFDPTTYTVLSSGDEKESQILKNLNLRQKSDKVLVGVGHSLGFQKLLNLPLCYHQLIGLQAFTCFLGFESSLAQKRRRLLKTMTENFTHQPQAVLSQFYKKCGVETDLKIQVSSLDNAQLTQDLNLLYDSQRFSLKTPTMILGTSYDKIVPPVIIYDNFAKLKNVTIEMLNLQGHCLGYQYEDIVFEKIANFVNASLQR